MTKGLALVMAAGIFGGALVGSIVGVEPRDWFFLACWCAIMLTLALLAIADEIRKAT